VKRCPFCDFEAADGREEVAHMGTVHADVVTERLRMAGFHPSEFPQPDLMRLRTLVADLAFYRSVRADGDDGGLGRAAWMELRDLVAQMPEAH
jgi:hypothetical protein